MSTIGSKAVNTIAAELAKKNIAMIDSPVSGGPRGARAGTLSTMAAGEHAAFECVKPMLQAAARNVFYVGEKPGLGQVTKLANNMISAAGMLAAYECSAMAVKAGVDARTLIDTVNAIVSGDLDPRDGTAALGFVNAMKDLPAYTNKGGMLYVFALP